MLIPRIRHLVLQLGLVGFVPVLGWSQIALVHVTSCGTEAFPGTCTIPSTGSGHLIVVGLQLQGGSTATTVSSVTDNAGNTYAEAGAARSIDAGGPDVVDIWYAKSSVAGATSITITPSASMSSCAAVIWEFSGANATGPLDQTAVLNSQAATTTPSGAPVTISSANEVVISLADVANGLTGIVSGNPFISESTLFGTGVWPNVSGWAYLVTSTTGTYSAQWTQPTAGTYASSTASFKAGSIGPSFTVSATPASQSVEAGTNAAFTMSVTPSGGFTGTVSLSAGGLPTGATASFNPSSITTSGSSTLTVTTTSSTAPASYPLDNHRNERKSEPDGNGDPGRHQQPL